MPAPKDPEKLAEWKRKLSERSKGRKTWNTGLKYSEVEGYEEYRDKLSKAHKGRKREPLSEETKQKISTSLTGKQKGKIVSQETRDKLSKAMSGRERSEEHKKNISKGRTGIKVSAKARQKMSRDRKGKPGTPHTDETKTKLSKLGKDKGWKPTGGMTAGGTHTDETKSKMSATRKGKPKSEEFKKKMSEIQTGKKHNYYSPGMKGKKHSEETRKKITKGLKEVEGVSRFKKGHKTWSTGKEMTLDYREKMSNSISDLYVSGSTKMGHVGNSKKGVYKSSKAGTIRYRSSYELIIYQRLDADINVATYECEPFTIKYKYGDAMKNYIPDLFITYTDGSQKLVEIKPEYLLQDPQNVAKFTAAKSLYPNFEIWSEDQL